MKNANTLRYLIVAGDERMLELAYILKRRHYHVSLYGFDLLAEGDISIYKDIKTAIDQSDVIIGPIPFLCEGDLLTAKYTNEPIESLNLLRLVEKDKILFFGASNIRTREICKELGIRFYDYNQDESYQLMNAMATAEGALSIIINETKTTLFDANIMVLGYGRIGKLLSKYLKALGANVYVEARKESDLTWIKMNSMTPIYLSDLDEYLSNMNSIINTIPSLILDEKKLQMINKDCLLIDLASKPGGIDFKTCEAMKIKAIHALGLPGKTAYKSSSIYIFDTIIKTLNAL